VRSAIPKMALKEVDKLTTPQLLAIIGYLSDQYARALGEDSDVQGK
jgi:hypothetical protein